MQDPRYTKPSFDILHIVSHKYVQIYSIKLDLWNVVRDKKIQMRPPSPVFSSHDIFEKKLKCTNFVGNAGLGRSSGRGSN
jgi:hypothetical protein